MESKQVLVDMVPIPDELAHQLSDLLTKQVIRERLLDRMVQANDEAGYENAEKLLAPVTETVEAIKIKITREYIPDQYQKANYVWNYSGYEVDGPEIEILENQ